VPPNPNRGERCWISFDKTWLSNQEVVDFRNMATTLTGIGSWSTGQQNLTGDGEPLRVGWASSPPTPSTSLAHGRCWGARSATRVSLLIALRSE